MPATTSPASDLNRFIARYTPNIAKLARGSLARMRKRLPTAHQLVYDNYNACGIGFGPTERASDVIFSIVLYPRRVSLFFLQAMKSDLEDRQKLLQGSGSLVRFIPLESPSQIDSAAVQRLMKQALIAAKVPLSRTGKGKLIIKSVSARQRSRRPAADR
jgi:ethanolamine utilization protein EutA (predicted chaperonin)